MTVSIHSYTSIVWILLLIVYVICLYYFLIKLKFSSLVTSFDLSLLNILNYVHYLYHLPVCNTNVYFSLVYSTSQGLLHLFLSLVSITLSYVMLHKCITHLRHHRMNTIHPNTLHHIKYPTTHTILALPSGLYHTYSLTGSNRTALTYDHI